MPELDNRQDLDGDEQDQSEAFDEENFDASQPGFDFAEMRTFEEAPAVRDATARSGDADDEEAMIGEEMDDDEIIEVELNSDATDISEDSLRTRMGERFDDDSLGIGDAEEVYHEEEAGLDLREGQGDEPGPSSQAGELDAGDLNQAPNKTRQMMNRLEAKDLADDDLAVLGYKEEDE